MSVPLPAANTAASIDRINGLLALGAGKANAGDTAGAFDAFNAALQIDPENFDAINNIGVMHCCLGNLAKGRPFIEKAYSLAPHDAEVRKNLIAVYEGLLPELYKKNEPRACLDVLRHHLALDPPDKSRLQSNLMDFLFRTGEKARLGDFAPGLAPEQLGQHLLIACMPKSGSSFLKETLRSLTGWKEKSFAFAYMRNEQELYLPAMLEDQGLNTVTQQHCRATQANIQLIQAFGIRPIILVRNIHDIVISLTDFYDAGAAYNSFLSRSWPALDPVQRRSAVIDHIVPWYLGFYASWMEACEADQVDALLVTYEQMIADKPATLASVADFLGLQKTVQECAAAVAKSEGNKTAIRMNKGIAGRGAATLDQDQKDRIAKLAAAYIGIDFSHIGL